MCVFVCVRESVCERVCVRVCVRAIQKSAGQRGGRGTGTHAARTHTHASPYYCTYCKNSTLTVILPYRIGAWLTFPLSADAKVEYLCQA